MAERNETEIREALNKVLDRAVNDAAYFKTLEENPAQALREAGLGPDATVTFSKKSGEGDVEGFCNTTTVCVGGAAGVGIQGTITVCKDTGAFRY